MISGQNIPRVNLIQNGDVVNPNVEIEMYGGHIDSTKKRTKVIRNFFHFFHFFFP